MMPPACLVTDGKVLADRGGSSETMSVSDANQDELERSHRQEVRKGARFEFGKNWSRFLANLTARRIKLAEQSLRTLLEVERLDDKTFLDIGSGSGLFSLAARRLGATVHSFDYDPQSVACTCELRRRYFEDDRDWVVEHGSVLDRDYLGSLGTFDVVYSWGVLHHTGQMWTALDNVKPLVPIGGRLFIAIYNDLGTATDEWARVKRTYCALPKPLAQAYALRIIGREEWKAFSSHRRNGSVDQWVRGWTHYDEISTRGMNRWHDWIDWVGGYPYERAKLEQVTDFFAKDGFWVTNCVDRSTGSGCNELVFMREAAAGVFVDHPIPGGASLAHRYGHRVIKPFQCDKTGVFGSISNVPRQPDGAALYLVRDGELIGRTELLEGNRVRIPGVADIEEIKGAVMHVISLKERALAPPFDLVRGRMWQASLPPESAEDADSERDGSRSALSLFEGEQRLRAAHASHDEIAALGDGRYSHWNRELYFSSTDGTDPNTNGRNYRVLELARLIPAETSFAKRFGFPLKGPFVHDTEGWKARVDFDLGNSANETAFLVHDDVVGEASIDDAGRVLVAPPPASNEHVERSEFYLVRGRMRVLARPFMQERGNMWRGHAPEFLEHAERETRRPSPLFLFENGRQLPRPNVAHDKIAALGGGRFCHWDEDVWFSTLDGSDPNYNGRQYCVIVASPVTGLRDGPEGRIES